jgi:hypothetical protein
MRAEMDSYRALRRRAEHYRAMEVLHRVRGLHEAADVYAADAAADEAALRRGHAPPSPPVVDPVDALLVAAHDIDGLLAILEFGDSDGVDVYTELRRSREPLTAALEVVTRQRAPRKSQAA